MIKSPCKDCEKYDLLFPDCITDCKILFNIQMYEAYNPKIEYSNFNRIEDMMFPVLINPHGRKYIP